MLHWVLYRKATNFFDLTCNCILSYDTCGLTRVFYIRSQSKHFLAMKFSVNLPCLLSDVDVWSDGTGCAKELLNRRARVTPTLK